MTDKTPTLKALGLTAKLDSGVRSRKTPGQIAYEAAAGVTGCQQPWAGANQEKWEAAGRAVATECEDICDGLTIALPEGAEKSAWECGTLDCAASIAAWMRVSK
jgi:hypothetical protein